MRVYLFGFNSFESFCYNNIINTSHRRINLNVRQTKIDTSHNEDPLKIPFPILIKHNSHFSLL